MKLLIVVTAALATATVLSIWPTAAQPEPTTYCEALAATYSNAATERDDQHSPYTAFGNSARYRTTVSQLDRLQAVDSVYFDSRYTSTAPDVIYGAVLGRCNNLSRPSAAGE